MTDKPQHDPEKDLINDILDSPMPLDVSRETAHGADRLSTEGGSEGYGACQNGAPANAQPPAPGKTPSRSSAVYLYLLILFGAAFLMLLLAYFVQQRNNEVTKDDLRLATASKEELVEEITKLKEEKKQWQADTQASSAALREEQERRRQAEEIAEYTGQEAQRYYREKQAANALAYLERFCAERDWLMAAVVVEDCDALFNEKNRVHDPDTHPDFVQAARYLELRETVFENAECMVTEGYSTAEDDSDYKERVYIHPSASRYKEEAVEAARQLWQIVAMYPNSPEARLLMVEFAAQPQWMEALGSRAFQPSTVELFHQLLDEFLARGWLEEQEDGTLAPVTLYGEDGGDEVDPTTVPVPR